jgi:hypothetical protein
MKTMNQGASRATAHLCGLGCIQHPVVSCELESRITCMEGGEGGGWGKATACVPVGHHVVAAQVRLALKGREGVVPITQGLGDPAAVGKQQPNASWDVVAFGLLQI